MIGAQHQAKMPDLVTFGKAFLAGVVGAQLAYVAYIAGSRSAEMFEGKPILATATVSVSLLVTLAYLYRRVAFDAARQMIESKRFALVAVVAIGVWAAALAAAYLDHFYSRIHEGASQWAILFLAFSLTLMLSSMRRTWIPPRKSRERQVYFISDDEITSSSQDELGINDEAKSFARMVANTASQQGVVIGLDGPWGIGKTSFLNLAQEHWTRDGDTTFLVFRFEPLRYAGDVDLASTFVRELTTFIRSSIFAPEVKPAAARYTRMMKGKAAISLFGLSFSFDPAADSVVDLLDDIDQALARSNKRIVIIVDDLDRLDLATVNSLLFVVRKGLKLQTATYVLCYDTERLVGDRSEKESARDFLEKFINVKHSLFIDSKSIRAFLEKDWNLQVDSFTTVPADRIAKMNAIVSELAVLVSGDEAAEYRPLLGDLRKVKRFINMTLLLHVDRLDTEIADFQWADLVNLMLLHLNYPGLFRDIYARETEGRFGHFSVETPDGEGNFKTSISLDAVIAKSDTSAGFLLKMLFDAHTVGVDTKRSVDEATLRTRACFNEPPYNNLERYLRLIVRLQIPEPLDSFALYSGSVDRVIRMATTVDDVLASPDLASTQPSYAQDQFWRVFTNRVNTVPIDALIESVGTLLNRLPTYGSVDGCQAENDDVPRALRDRSIYSLLRMLDAIGSSESHRTRTTFSTDPRQTIIDLIFGDSTSGRTGILARLASADRGALGWNDLMLFRLQCSADRLGRLQNILRALLSTDDPEAEVHGPISTVTRQSMRRLSQAVFALFRSDFVIPKRNFLEAVNALSEDDLLGSDAPVLRARAHTASGLGQRVEATRTAVKSFVLYQLCNRQDATGSGIGCGFYDVDGRGDAAGIAAEMNNYIFDVCFGGDAPDDHLIYFLDFSLGHLTNSFFVGGEEEGFVPTQEGILSGLDPDAMRRYWQANGDAAKKVALANPDRTVVTDHYIAKYGDDLQDVFAVLDLL